MKEIKNVLCVYHSADLDGWMSAAIVMKWFMNEFHEPRMIGTDLENYSETTMSENIGSWSVLDFCAYNYGDKVPDTSAYDCVMMCDVSFPENEMYKLTKRLGNYFVYNDHHISMLQQVEKFDVEPNGFRSVDYAGCELTWKYCFNDETMPEIVRLLGMYDSFRHKNTGEEQKVLEFQYGARSKWKNRDDCYYALVNHPESEVVTTLNAGRHIYEYLKTEALQSWKRAYAVRMLTEQQGWVKLAVVNKERFNPINFGIDYHKEGYDAVVCYWYNGKNWVASVYNDNGNFDCSVFAKSFGGGGHKGAAGFMIDDIKMWANKTN